MNKLALFKVAAAGSTFIPTSVAVSESTGEAMAGLYADQPVRTSQPNETPKRTGMIVRVLDNRAALQAAAQERQARLAARRAYRPAAPPSAHQTQRTAAFLRHPLALLSNLQRTDIPRPAGRPANKAG